MQKIFEKSGLIVLSLGACLLYLTSTKLTKMQGLALMAGYVLSVANWYLLKTLAQLLVTANLGQEQASSYKKWLIFGSLLKFFGLFVALFLILVVFQLPALYVAAAALLALFLIASTEGYLYLRRLSSQRT